MLRSFVLSFILLERCLDRKKKNRRQNSLSVSQHLSISPSIYTTAIHIHQPPPINTCIVHCLTREVSLSSFCLSVYLPVCVCIFVSVLVYEHFKMISKRRFHLLLLVVCFDNFFPERERETFFHLLLFLFVSLGRSTVFPEQKKLSKKEPKQTDLFFFFSSSSSEEEMKGGKKALSTLSFLFHLMPREKIDTRKDR